MASRSVGDAMWLPKGQFFLFSRILSLALLLHGLCLEIEFVFAKTKPKTKQFGLLKFRLFFTSLKLNLLSLPKENNLKRVIPPTAWGWTVITIATIALELS